MFKVFLFLHLATAIFAIGPLVHAVTTAARGLRTGDEVATAASARTTKIYAYASVVVVILGLGLMSMKTPYGDHQASGDFGDLWIWLSVLLWLVAVALSLFVTVPALEKATTALGSGGNVDSLRGRVAASGGVVGLLFVVIVALMVYRPGS